MAAQKMNHPMLHQQRQTRGSEWAQIPCAVLRELRLSETQLLALKLQGCVSLERSHSGRMIGKLRFRAGGRQVVRYVGADEHRLAAVRHALAQWQAAHHAARRLQHTMRAAAALLREARHRSEAVLAGSEFRHHGYAIRRRRQLQLQTLSTLPSAQEKNP